MSQWTIYFSDATAAVMQQRSLRKRPLFLLLLWMDIKYTSTYIFSPPPYTPSPDSAAVQYSNGSSNAAPVAVWYGLEVHLSANINPCGSPFDE